MASGAMLRAVMTCIVLFCFFLFFCFSAFLFFRALISVATKEVFVRPGTEVATCQVCVCVASSIPGTVCFLYAYCMSDWTLGAAAHPFKKLAMSVRRHTKVLADGEG